MSAWNLSWHKQGPTETLGEFAASREDYVRLLRAADPGVAKANWIRWGSTAKAEHLDEDLGNFRRWVLKYGWDPMADKRLFSHLTDQGAPSPEATSEVGYRLKLTDSATRVENFSIELFSTHAALDHRGRALFKLAPDMLKSVFLKRLIQVTVDHHDPDSCCVFSLDFDRAIGNQFKPGPASKDFLRIGWITYFGNPAVREVLPADIHAEPFGSGLLVTTQPTVPDLSRSEDIERGRRLVEALRTSGWLMLSRMKRDPIQAAQIRPLTRELAWPKHEAEYKERRSGVPHGMEVNVGGQEKVDPETGKIRLYGGAWFSHAAVAADGTPEYRQMKYWTAWPPLDSPELWLAAALEQATRQAEVIAPLHGRLVWEVPDLKAAEMLSRLFEESELEIEVRHVP